MEITENPQQDRLARRAEKRRKRELSDIRFILNTREGRRFYWRILEKGEIFRDAYVDQNTNYTFYKLGRQSCSRDFLNDLLEAKSDALVQMQNERAAEEQSDILEEEKELKNERKPGELG